MPKYEHQTLLNKIHSSERDIRPGKYFSFPCQITNLGFLGANSTIITSFGAVWERNNIVQNSRGYIQQGYAPMKYRDSTKPYKWVNIRTSSGVQPFPINLLLGWAFRPETVIAPREFVAEDAYIGMEPIMIDHYHWQDADLNAFTPIPSAYLNFLRSLYRTR